MDLNVFNPNGNVYANFPMNPSLPRFSFALFESDRQGDCTYVKENDAFLICLQWQEEDKKQKLDRKKSLSCIYGLCCCCCVLPLVVWNLKPMGEIVSKWSQRSAGLRLRLTSLI